MAYRTQAVSQAGELQLALSTYAGDNNQSLPIAGGGYRPTDGTFDGWFGCTFWGNHLIDNGYIPLEKTTTCSSSTNQIFWSPGHYPKIDTENMQDFLCFSGFGANTKGAFGHYPKNSTHPIRLSSPGAPPAQLLTLVDNSFEGESSRREGSNYVITGSAIPLFSYAGWVPCAFLDGHASVNSGQEELGFRVTGKRTGTWIEPSTGWYWSDWENNGGGVPWFNGNPRAGW